MRRSLMTLVLALIFFGGVVRAGAQTPVPAPVKATPVVATVAAPVVAAPAPAAVTPVVSAAPTLVPPVTTVSAAGSDAPVPIVATPAADAGVAPVVAAPPATVGTPDVGLAVPDAGLAIPTNDAEAVGLFSMMVQAFQNHAWSMFLTALLMLGIYSIVRWKKGQMPPAPPAADPPKTV